MKHVFDGALLLVLAHEGGYVNHRADPGGPTNLGVTLRTARRYGIDIDGDGDTDVVDVKRLTPDHAAIVYRRGYWDAVRGDELPAGVDYAVFDLAVNSGPHRAAVFLQRALGVVDDGTVGPVTLEAAHAADAARLVNDICDARLRFLRRLSTWRTFGTGWSRRVEDVRRQAVQMARSTADGRADVPATTGPRDPPLPRRFSWRLIALVTAVLLGGLFLLFGRYLP